MIYKAKKQSDKLIDVTFPFPNTDLSPEQKNSAEYCVKWAKGIYSRFIRNRTSFPYSLREWNEFLRDYGRGNQPEDQYKTWLTGTSDGNSSTDIPVSDYPGSKNGNRKGWYNVDWSIISPAPKIRNMLQGMFYNVDFNISCDAVDSNSGAEEETKKYRLYTEAIQQKFSDTFKLRAGIPIEQKAFIPDSKEELEAYEAVGGFKTNYSKAMQKLLKHTFNISDWDRAKPRMLDDAIDLARMAAKDYYDEETGSYRARYIDVNRVVIQDSEYFDHRDSEYGGYFTTQTISFLRTKGIKEHELKKIARNYCGYYGNPSEDKWDSYSNYNSDESKWAYDEFKVCVFEACWIDVDSEYYKIKLDKFGKKQIIKKENKDKGKEGVEDLTVRNVYECCWVVDTDICYDYGIMYNQPRPKDSEVALPLHVYRMGNKSITATLKPIYDYIQLAWLRFQNDASNAVSAGYAIDVQYLNQMKDGKNKMDTKDVIKFFRQTGIFLYRGNTGFNRGGSPVPINQLPGGMGTRVMEAIQMLQFCFKMIEDFTGLSPIALGQQPKPDQAVATTQMALQSTNNYLRPFFEGIMRVKETLSRNIGNRIQIALRYDKKAQDYYKRVVGDYDIKLMQTADATSRQYGFELNARPSEQEKQELYKLIDIAMANGRDQRPGGIDMQTAAQLKRMLFSGEDLKEIEFMLGYKQRKFDENVQMSKERNMQMQQQGNMQLQQMQQQAKMQEKDMDIRGEIAVDNNSFQNEMRKMIAEKNVEYRMMLEKQVMEEEAAKRQQQMSPQLEVEGEGVEQEQIM